MHNEQPAVNQQITVEQKAKPRRRSRKAPAIKTAVAVRRAQGQAITHIAKDLGIAINTTKAILRETDVDSQIENYRGRALELVPRAFDALDHSLTHRKDGTLAIRYLEDMRVIGPDAAQSRPARPNIAAAINILIQPNADKPAQVIDVKADTE